MQIIQVQPGNMYVLDLSKLRNVSALNDLDHDLSVDDLSEV